MQRTAKRERDRAKRPPPAIRDESNRHAHAPARRLVRPSLLALAALIVVTVGAAAPTFDDAMKSATADYHQRAELAAKHLTEVRARVDGEKAPLLSRIRTLETRLVALESDATHIETQHANAGALRHEALQSLETIRKSTGYVGTLARDAIKAAADGLAPGENRDLAEEQLALQKRLDSGGSSAAAMDAADAILAHVEQSVGGYRTAGRAISADTRQVVDGTFAFTGPEVYFMAAQGGAPSVVRPHEDSKFPIAYPLPGWSAEHAAPFFAGQSAPVLMDPSTGKALKLAETRGTLRDHIEKGGTVAYAILIVGVIALLLVAQKLRDLRAMAVDAPEIVRAVLENVANGDFGAADRATANLRPATRELFSVGLRHAAEPKPILEERLQAVLLEQRLRFERRLPLLAVIATASPLMGLLGTVVGMVRTFALITVFGTGNAGKLSSGISEVLIATELGLMVAIPTLVMHGFLAQAVHRRLGLLERYALELATAVQSPAAARPDNQATVRT